ncbi:tungsten formylmethanofuran dehydrogenase [Mesorhizobium sp. A623]
MAVAWIGSRETSVERAAEHAASLLQASRCPVFSLDTDVHGTRAAIALAERTGAAYDHVSGAALARETALFTDRGAMTVALGEVRRRADVVVIVGEIPETYRPLLVELSGTTPDLSAANARSFFFIGNDGGMVLGADSAPLACGKAGLNATLAAIRASLGGRQVSTPVSNFDAFAGALKSARYPVFVFSGHGVDRLGLEMLQGLLDDLNQKSRASGLHLPASESGWGSILASTWMTGFAPRTGFSRGFPEYDPWRYDVARMIAAGEADLHLWIAPDASQKPKTPKSVSLIALTKTVQPVTSAAVTIAIGEAGIDHDGVVYSARAGTLRAVSAGAVSQLPSTAAVLRTIAGHFDAEAALPC